MRLWSCVSARRAAVAHRPLSSRENRSHLWGFFPVGSAATHMVLAVLVCAAPGPSEPLRAESHDPAIAPSLQLERRAPSLSPTLRNAVRCSLVVSSLATPCFVVWERNLHPLPGLLATVAACAMSLKQVRAQCTPRARNGTANTPPTL